MRVFGGGVFKEACERSRATGFAAKASLSVCTQHVSLYPTCNDTVKVAKYCQELETKYCSLCSMVATITVEVVDTNVWQSKMDANMNGDTRNEQA